MKCRMCDSENEEGATVCSKCGQKLVLDKINTNNNLLSNINSMPTVNTENKEKKSDFKLPKIDAFMIIIFVLVIVLIVLMVLYFKPKRDKVLSSTGNNNFTFKINEDEFNINSSFSEYINKGYYIEDDNYYIKYDSISLNNIYKDEKAIGLAAFYCPNKEGCSYKETNVVKLNLYDISNISIKDLKKNDGYDEVVKKLGKESGVLSTDNTYYIWSNGKSIGDSYIMIKFSNKRIDDLKIGVWWYGNEYNHSVKEN